MFTFDAITYATLVFFLNTVLYAVLLMGQGVVYRYDISLCIPWVRWAVYAVSCSMLAYKIALFQRMVSSVRVVFVGMITATMLFGLFSVLSVHVETNRWIWFGIGFAPYLIAILVLFVFIDPCNYLASQGGVFLMFRIPVFVLVFWSLYPLPFVLGPTLTYTISSAGEAWFYLALDLFTKVFFGFYLAFLEAKY
jgi:bacteriorhodopsin